MNNIIAVLSLMTIIFSCGENISSSVSNDTSNAIKDDTKVESMGHRDYVEMLTQSISIVNNDRRLLVQDAINLCKLYNTINYYHISDTNSLYFNEIFIEKRLNETVGLLGGELTIGMGYYCPKYSLYIGGSIQFADNSYYELDTSRASN